MQDCLKCAASLVAVVLFQFQAQAGAEPRVSFHEEGLSAGVRSVYTGDYEFMVGGGVATFDCNSDGFADMLLAGGTSKATFYRNMSKAGGAIRFAAEQSGLELDSVTGAYPLDIDSDGIIDLAVLRVGENVLMRGQGDCKFARANEQWGFDGGDAWSTAFAAAWEKGAKLPMLAIGNYIDRKQVESPWGSCTDNWLFRPSGDALTYARPIPLTPSYCALSMLFTDWNRSGTPSLRVSNDREYYEGGQEQMWRVEPASAPHLYTQQEGWKFLRIWGMGIASYDLNLDGFPEYYLSSMGDQHLQVLADVPKDGQPRPAYSNVPYSRGLTAHRPYTGGDLRPSTGWHTQFEDVDNDSYVDLFVAKGNVAEMEDFAMRDPNNLLRQSPDGTFHEIGDAAGMASMAISRGAALVDFNMDGRLDLAVVNRWSAAQVWRNTTREPGNWLQVRPRQTGANPDAIGGWIEVRLGNRVLRRELASGGGHVSGQNGWWHFGLGDATSFEIRMIWPDGKADPWVSAKADQFLIYDRTAGVTAWVPPR